MDYGMAADQYVAETGDPSGISCFCYKETYRIDCNGRFLEICGVQFRKDYTGIFSGLDPGNGSGGTFFCFFCYTLPCRTCCIELWITRYICKWYFIYNCHNIYTKRLSIIDVPAFPETFDLADIGSNI